MTNVLRPRITLVVTMALLAAASAAAVWTFLWPDGDSWISVGAIEDFAPGTVTTFGGEGDPRSFHIVRLESGELLALWARDPHLGHHVPYRPDFVYDGRAGWFRNPHHGETYDMAGQRVFGPAPRGLDRFALEIRSGSVYVDPYAVTRGARIHPEGYEFQTGGVLITAGWLRQP